MNPYLIRNLNENLNARLKDFADTVRAHDTIHPHRGDCGGVGGCVLMRTEHDAREALTDTVEHATRNGLTITMEARKDPK